MGLFDKILRKMPGSPTSVAKTMLKIYNGYMTHYPDRSKQDALRYAIESRYQVLKTLNESDIDACLSEAEDLGDLVFLVVGKENPVAVQYPYMKQTVDDLYDFFTREAPHELGGALQRMKALVGIQF